MRAWKPERVSQAQEKIDSGASAGHRGCLTVVTAGDVPASEGLGLHRSQVILPQRMGGLFLGAMPPEPDWICQSSPASIVEREPDQPLQFLLLHLI